jgi:hypothetical protein
MKLIKEGPKIANNRHPKLIDLRPNRKANCSTLQNMSVLPGRGGTASGTKTKLCGRPIGLLWLERMPPGGHERLHRGGEKGANLVLCATPPVTIVARRRRGAGVGWIEGQAAVWPALAAARSQRWRGGSGRLSEEQHVVGPFRAAAWSEGGGEAPTTGE